MIGYVIICIYKFHLHILFSHYRPAILTLVLKDCIILILRPRASSKRHSELEITRMYNVF